MAEAVEGSTVTLVEAHVHIHDCFELETFFDGARANLERAASQTAPDARWSGVLCLTEGASDDAFAGLLAAAGAMPGSPPPLGRWTVRTTGEDVSLNAVSDRGESLLVISGYQVQAREGLEVLTLATRRRIADGTPLDRVLEEAALDGAVAVLPWGFGKWIGRRGAIVRRLVSDTSAPDFHLGDSANRPGFLSRPRLLDEGDRRGRYDLPGSDPLPFRREQTRAGHAGFVLRAALEPETPGDGLRERLAESGPVERFVRKESVMRFLRNQVAMQRRKRGRSGD